MKHKGLFVPSVLVFSSLVWVSAACISAQSAPAETPTPPAPTPAQAPAAGQASPSAPVQAEMPQPATAIAAKLGPDEDPDKEKFVQVCESCHGTMLITMGNRRSAQEWATLIDDMIARGAPGTEADAKVIGGYLFRHYGKVNVNKAPQEVLATVLDITAAQAKAICDYRTAQGEFKALADLAKVGVLDATAIEERKDRIAFSGD